MRRPVVGAAATLGVLGAIFAGLLAANLGAASSPSPSAPGGLVAGASTGPSAWPSASAGPSAAASPAATLTPTPTPLPTPVLVAAPLTGRLVTPAVAAQHPIAVMIDDLDAARPQSGFNAADVVWQAPAEGGIPRYMLVFQDQIPAAVGPVRSARYYYIAWAAQWRALYVHVGGSPQALQTLQAQGHGQLVYNADEFRYGGKYLWRIHTRSSPHNVYTDGAHLRSLAKAVGARDGEVAAGWTFAPDAELNERPLGGSIEVAYPYNAIRYDYDRTENVYRRGVTGAARQIDAADGKQVAPKNVVIMLVHFGPLGDDPKKQRLEATVLGSGTAWIASNGKTVKGTWRKSSLTGPVRFYDAAGHQVTLTVGQTFVQVVPIGTRVTIKDGTPAPPSYIQQGGRMMAS